MNQPDDLGVWFEHHAHPIAERYHSSGRGALSPKDYTSFLLYTLQGEVGNGGTEQFFFNAGQLAVDTVAALQAIGAVRAAKLLSEICRCFPEGVLGKDVDEIREEYGRLPPMFFELCSRFDVALMGSADSGYILDEDIAGLLFTYLSKH